MYFIIKNAGCVIHVVVGRSFKPLKKEEEIKNNKT
jgi:hypothetical protein